MREIFDHLGIPYEIEDIPVWGEAYRLPSEHIVKALRACKEESGYRCLLDTFGVDTGEGIDALYLLRDFSNGQDLLIKVSYPYGATLQSVWMVFKSALMPERELCEMFGLLLAGHPNPKRLLTSDGCPPFLLKKTALRTADEVRHRESQNIDIHNLNRVSGWISGDTDAENLPEPAKRPVGIGSSASPHDDVYTEHMILNMGPQHPSTHGVLRLLLELDGEMIVNGEAIVGNLHRGIEKLGETRAYEALGTLLDRGDYVSGMNSELAAALATEQLLGIDPSPRAHWIRSLVCELNRIASHMVWYGPNALDSGVMGLFLYLFAAREDILDILEEISGQRMMFNYVRPGGVVADITPRAEKLTREFLKNFSARMDEHEDLVMENELFLARIRGIGRLSYEDALDFGLTGANLRASGGTWDVRKNRPYAAYDKLDFEVPTATEGDTLARFRVRIAEMRQSLRIIEQCLDGMPEGDPTSEIPKKIKPPKGEAYGCVEGPRGEMGIHLISDGTATPYRMRYRPPVLYALQAGEYLLPGMLIADAVVGLGSLDFVLGEIDR